MITNQNLNHLVSNIVLVEMLGVTGEELQHQNHHLTDQIKINSIKDGLKGEIQLNTAA